MSTSAMKGHGTTLYIEDLASPTQRALVTERVRFTTSESRNNHDVTDMDSTRREYKAGIADSGEMQLEIWFLPTNSTHARLRNAFNENTASLRARQFEIGWTSGNTWRFQAEVSKFDVSGMEVDGEIKATLTLRITGNITEA